MEGIVTLQLQVQPPVEWTGVGSPEKLAAVHLKNKSHDGFP